MNFKEEEAKPQSHRSGRRPTLLVPGGPWSRLGAILILLAVMLPALFATSASAAKVRPAKGTFGSAARPSFIEPAGMAVEPSTGDLLVIDYGNQTLSQFKPNGEPDNFSALGANVIDGKGGPGGAACAAEPASCDETPGNAGVLSSEGFGSAETEIAVAPPGAAGGTEGDIYVTDAYHEVVDVFAPSGEYLTQLAYGYSCGVAVGPDGDVFIGDYYSGVHKLVPSGGGAYAQAAEYSQPGTCQVAAGAGSSDGYVFAAEFLFPPKKIASEGSEEGESQYTVPSGPEPTTFSVDPASGDLFVATPSAVKEYDVSGTTEATEVAPSIPVASAALGVAVNETSGETYVSRAGKSQVEAFGPVTSVPLVITEGASAVQPDGATLNGLVDPEGVQLSECVFEYGRTAGSGFEAQIPCGPGAGEIPADFSPHAVTGALHGLQPNTAYRFRLKAANSSGAAEGAVRSLTTQGVPAVTEVRALNADQTSASVEAKIKPFEALTHYFIEWGPTSAYGRRIPNGTYEPSAGSGDAPVSVRAELSGLATGATYHYRFVARNKYGTAVSGDNELETLDSCGLPEQRCFELVSPASVGPVASPGEYHVDGNLHFQAAATKPALVYAVENGLPGATRGGEVLYQATWHEEEGWTSIPISTPILTRSELVGGGSAPEFTLGLSSELACGVLATGQPVANSPAMELVSEAGGTNLYRREGPAALTAITTLAPTNPEDSGAVSATVYQLAGMSDDCATVAFATEYNYPGVGAEPGGSGSGQKRLYEWRDGGLKSVGMVPGESGELISVPAVPGGGQEDHWNAVSPSGARIFFSAHRVAPGNPGNPGEAGKIAVFVREEGITTRDLSASETGVPDLGATYQYASADGSRVFFTANAGLTDESSAEGTDLYEYDLEKAPTAKPLTDLSVGPELGGAGVAGFVGASSDGSRVYFLAEGQLDPGQGKTFAENGRDDTYSLYSKQESHPPQFVASVKREEASKSSTQGGLAVQPARLLTSRVSQNGQFLLFETAEQVTDAVPEGVRQAYIFDANAGSGQAVCVSCQQNGEAVPVLSQPLAAVGGDNELFQSRTLAVRNGRPIVFFKSSAPLTGVGGQMEQRLYEWTHDQVFMLAGPTPTAPEFAGGANENGSDVYFATSTPLTWEDADDRSSVYDARIGGRVSAPPPTPGVPCAPSVEGSCQNGAATGQSAPAAGTATFSGPGNLPAKQTKKKKHKKKKHKKKHSKSRSGKKIHRHGGRHDKPENNNGRAGR